MRRWLLPEAIEDALPQEAGCIERLRRRLLDAFQSEGYELVMPPLLEYLESLLTGTGRDLELRTFKLVDQASGRSMGIRADITPQVARIDAHLLNREGVVRMCYCGSVLHTLPAGISVTREPLQIGAELYGHAGLEADEEILRLLARALDLAGVRASRIDLGHVGVFRALSRLAGLDGELEQDLFHALQAKDRPGIAELLAGVAEPARSGLLALPDLYGDAAVLVEAERRLPADDQVRAALDDLSTLGRELADLPVSFDFADLRGYHYHNGAVFAAYCGEYPGAIALGGRYDHVGRSFGRSRPATGFSMDLRELARLAPEVSPRRPILAPCARDEPLQEAIRELRSRGETVVVELPGHEGTWHEIGSYRRLAATPDGWRVRESRGGEG